MKHIIFTPIRQFRKLIWLFPSSNYVNRRQTTTCSLIGSLLNKIFGQNNVNYEKRNVNSRKHVVFKKYFDKKDIKTCKNWRGLNYLPQLGRLYPARSLEPVISIQWKTSGEFKMDDKKEKLQFSFICNQMILAFSQSENCAAYIWISGWACIDAYLR